MESRTEKLGDIADITTGKTPSKRIENAYGNVIKFLTPRDFSGRFSVTTERMLSDQGYQAVYNQIVSGPSVSVTCIGSDMGKVIYNRESVVTNQQVNTLSNFKSNVDPLFLYYLLSTKKQELLSYGAGNGSTMPIITKSMFSKLEIKLPSVKVQRKLVACLSLLDDKIELNQQINKNLLRLCRIQFNRVKLACSSTTDLSNIAVLMMGQSPKGNTYNQKGEGTPLLNGAADFRGGINPSKYTSDPKKVTKPGDYVFGVRATIGLTTKVFGRYAIGRGTGLARSLKPESDELLYFILEDSFDYFSHAATGSVYPNVSRKDFETYSSPAFSDNSQRVFHSFAAPLMEKIYQDETQNKKLTQIRDILLPKLLSGSVDLSGIEEAMKNA